MIRIVLLTLCSIGVGSTLLAQDRHFEAINGTRVSVILTSDQLSNAPTCLYDTEDEPPLSVGKAIERAKSGKSKERIRAAENEESILKIVSKEIVRTVVFSLMRSIQTLSRFTVQMTLSFG